MNHIIRVEANSKEANDNKQSSRAYKRYTPKAYIPESSEQFLVQRAWGHFIQIHLFESHTIIGQITNISLGGIACKVIYQFDVIDPIEIDVTFNLKSNEHDANCFTPVSLPAVILRSTKDSQDNLINLGIKFMQQNDYVKSQVSQLINEIS